MPPRFMYWTIIFGGQPTSFRSATRDELLPTFKQIQSKHPDAQLRYFARGKLWYSDEEARAALIRERFEKSHRKSSPGRDRSRPHNGATAARGERRGRDWRPGGTHTDPRDRFKVPRDVKRARFKAKFQRDRFNAKSDPHKPRGPRPGHPRGPRPHVPRPPRPKKDDE